MRTGTNRTTRTWRGIATLLFTALLAPGVGAVTIIFDPIDPPPPPILTGSCDTPLGPSDYDWNWRFAETTLTVAPGSSTVVNGILENRACSRGGATLAESIGFYFDALPQVDFEFFGVFPVSPVPPGPPFSLTLPDIPLLVSPGTEREFTLGIVTVAEDYTGDSFVIEGDTVFLAAPDYPPPLPTSFGGPLPPGNVDLFKGSTNSLTVTVATVPVPGTLALVALGLGLVAVRRNTC